MSPTVTMTIAMAAAMTRNTPVVPKSVSTPAIKNEVKIAEKRLQEYTKPTALARTAVGKSSDW